MEDFNCSAKQHLVPRLDIFPAGAPQHTPLCIISGGLRFPPKGVWGLR